MRTLSENLTAAQAADTIDDAYKVTLTHASPPEGQEATYTYYKDAHTATRLLLEVSNHREELYLKEATVVLDNSDQSLNDIDFEGYTAVISYGAWISGAGDYGDAANLYVVDQNQTDAPSDLRVILSLKCDMWKLENDRASDNVTPASDDARTVKTWIREIMGDTGVTHLAEYNHCTAYDVVFDSEDDLLDSYAPNDGFRIYKNSTRLSALRRLLDHTKCIARFENDGDLHVFNPTISGTTYDYEYKFNVDDEHEFYSKNFQISSTVPNYIVVDTIPDAAVAYQGTASVTEKIGVFRAYFQKALASDDEGDDLAEAILAKFQLHRQIGGVTSRRQNAGQEVGDYIKVTSSRSGKDRVGNVSVIIRNVGNNNLPLQMYFGGWATAKGISALLETYDDNYSAMERMAVKNMYIENLTADNIDLTTIDQDDIADGTTYGRILNTHIDAGKIKLTAQTTVDGFDLDGLPNGSVYERVKATQISAGEIQLTSTSFLINQSQVRLGVSEGNRLELKSTGIKGFSLVGEVETEEFHIDATDGTIKCGAGAVVMGANGILVIGEYIVFNDGSNDCGYVKGASGDLYVVSADNRDVVVSAGSGVVSVGGTTVNINATTGTCRTWKPQSNDTYDLGASDKYWLNCYFGNIHHSGTLGFFGGTPTTKTSVADMGSPSDMAGSDTINKTALDFNVAALFTKMNALLDALQSYALV